ncbi:unnamed protein product [Pleuronectes platessa]|uniref:IQ motif containing GTPase activating protein 3 n=1 Tax=Pleuronectes platessa TaxID=8262 RepID=A0A9N7TPL6_PLEPL|nr:unnamed protein product [Pleuronectes platessa]
MADNTAAETRYERLTAEQMDEQRIQSVAYQYLCRLEEAKRWMEACLVEELPAPTDLEEGLRNGVILAKLGHRFAPSSVPLKKIYDPEQLRYQAVGLQFRHTDNINHWRNAMTRLGLPAIFYPETTDVYDKKNMPRTVYCIHALSLYLYRLGVAPQIHDLYGKVKFTDEEINNMKLELDKYGIQMPAFNKIGGILANEVSVDEAAVHAAVIAINEAVDRGELGVTTRALRNPNAMLRNLQEALMSVYQEMLRQARRRKAEGASSWSQGSADKDMYEEFLTQREIQNNITVVNVRSAVEQVDEALDSADELSLLSALQLPCLALRGLHTDNGPWYLDQLSVDRQQRALEGCVDPLNPDDLQDGITLANEDAKRARNMQAAVQNANAALRGSDHRHTLSCLMTSDLQLPQVFPFAAALYHRELQLLQRQSGQGELQQEELFVAVEMLSAVALINQSLEAGNLQQFNSSLVSSSAGLSDVDDTLLDRYFERLADVKQQGGRAHLTWNQLQEKINSVNSSVLDAQQKLVVLGVINKAVIRGDNQQLLSALLLPSCGLEDVLPHNACRYLTLMSRARQHKAQVSRDPGAELCMADIQEEVRRANQQSQRALKLCLSVAAVNQAVKENRDSQTLRVLSLPELQLQGIIRECAAEYQRQLHNLITHKMDTGDNRGAWTRVRADDGSLFYFHLKRLEGTWERPDGFTYNSVFMDRHEIQDIISSVSGSHSRSALWRSREALVVRLQASCRGFLIRRQLEARQRFLINNTAAAVVIQSHRRRCVQQRRYRRRLQFLYMNWRAVVKIQSFVKMWLMKRKYRARLSFFKRNEGAVIKIQSFFRASRARDQYRMLVHSDTPHLSVVRKFVHLLDLGDGDIREEAELLRLRAEVVRSIRFNRQLEADLDLMDLKIGLLVRNKATLQEVVSHCKKLTRKNKEQLSDMMDVERSKGLKALSRERRERLEAYQHLFYLLQTQPLYLAQLIFLMPHTRSTSFMEMLVFSLFNYGSDHREAYLLLQLFTEALHYEISLKVDQPQDVVTGNPTVIKMLVNFYRRAHGQNVLRETLCPALQDVLQDRTLSIRTDPVDVYKTWINQTESQTGLKSTLPYDVSPEDALSHPEVQRRIDVSIINLKNLTDRVLNAITCNLHKLPPPPHHATSSPLHLLTTSPPHHFTSSPVHLLTSSPPHRFTSSPLHLLTTSPPHHFTSSPVHLLTSSPPHHFTSSPLHLLTTSPLHLLTTSPPHLFTSSPLHLLTASPPHHFTSSPVHLLTCPPLHLLTTPPLHLLTTSPPHQFTSSPPHLFTSSPLHLLTTSPPHHFTTSPPHHFTSSPLHLLTTPPPHHFTSSPLHHFTSSPVHLLTTSPPHHSPPHHFTSSPLHHFTSSPLHLLTSSPLHLLTSSPLHLLTTSPPHHFTSSPLHLLTTSPPHHFTSSPLPLLTTSPPHHFTSSPLHQSTSSPPHHFTSSPLHLLTTSPPHHSTSSPLHLLTTSPPHHFTSSPLHHSTSSPVHLLTSSPPHHSTSSPLHLLTSSPPHLFTSSPLHLLTTSPPHQFTSSPLHLLTTSPPHLLTTSPPHHFTSSPLHLLTTSPPHHFTSSPLHLLTTSPPHLFTSSPLHLLTTSPPHHSTSSPLHLLTPPPPHHFTSSPLHLLTTHLLTTSPPHLLTTSPPHHFTSSPVHLLTTSPPHQFTSSPLHLLTTSPPHHFTSSPLHLLTTSPPHHFTSSPLHLLTTPPPHHSTSSPLHLLTTSPPHHSTCPPLHLSTTPPVHHFTSSPLHLLTTPPVHHFTSSPLHLLTTSPPHHFTTPPVHLSTSSPLHLSTTSPPHHFTSSPLHLLTTSPPHHFTTPPVHHSTSSPLHLSTTSPPHHFTSSPLHLLTTSPPHHFTSSPLHHSTCPPLHLLTPPPPHHFTCPPLHLLTPPPPHHFTSSPLHLLTTPPPHHFTSSPLHLLTTSPPHHFTSSPLHLLTPSPPHHFTSSPVHHFTSSPLHLYGLRYTAKVLRDALKTKFPDASEDELYKIVGNLVYYRYMNPAIVAPDGFDVVDRSAGSALQPEQRHVLGSIARVLQHAAANKRFHGDGYHVAALNQYIGQTHHRFRRFLLSVCDVPEPEERFSVDEFSELLVLSRPVIYISVSELLNTHKLLLEHQDVLCPDSSDPLRLLLQDLGPVPPLQELTGESSLSPSDPESALTHSCKTEVSLTLTNKFDIFNDSDDKPDARGLLLSTKQLIIDVIRTQPGDTLSDILRRSPSHDQEVCHDWLIQQRARQDARTPEKMKRNQSLVANGNLSLEEKKRKILRSLRRLEGLGVLTSPRTENQILQMIAKDIRQQRLHRQRRGAELLKLRHTLSSLEVKSSFHTEQVDYYRHYITSCLDNLTASKSNKKKTAESTGKKKPPALSYSATRLQEKGVLLEIEDLPPTQFKNVVFDIVAGAERGSFRVKTRFLGVEMEEFLLKYQDLLQLQYEGVAVMKMFDKAKINVNLLIFLLNKKFFKK